MPDSVSDMQTTLQIVFAMVREAFLNLVSDESADGKGSFAFSRGTDAMGTLQLWAS